MDETLASDWLTRFQGKQFHGLTICDLKGNGKSAAVFHVTDAGGQPFALKIFDKAIVEANGIDAQKERIKRELKLKSLIHPNIIKIIDAGYDDDEQKFYIQMELIAGEELNKKISTIPREKIRPLISQLAQAVKFLEDNGLTHRDIKPNNIMITDDYSKLILLDFGVVRPHDATNITDINEPHFLGTLRYGSPEFLRRKEEQTIEGWRALTFYQIGGVLHDMIMKKPLFLDKAPYPCLVEAIFNEEPQIDATDVPGDLIVLAKNCLVKDPKLRLQVVTWDQFFIDSTSDEFERMRKVVSQRRPIDPETARRAEILMANKTTSMMDRIDSIVRSQISKEDFLPPATFQLLTSNLKLSGLLLVSFLNPAFTNTNSQLNIIIKLEILGSEFNVIHISFASTLEKIGSNFAIQNLESLEFKSIYKSHFDPVLFKVAFMRSLTELWASAVPEDSPKELSIDPGIDLIESIRRSTR